MYSITNGECLGELTHRRSRSVVKTCSFSLGKGKRVVYADANSMIWRFDHVPGGTLDEWDAAREMALE